MALPVCMYLLVGLRNIITQHWKLLGLSFLMFLVLCGLGTWQVARLYEKRALISQLEASLIQPAIDIPSHESPPLFTNIRLTGHFLETPPFLLTSKPYAGDVGQYVVSPFQTEQGETILVLRGWTNQPAPTPSTTPTTITGQVRTVKPARWFEPVNTPHSWVRIDPTDMGQSLQMTLAPFYVLERSPPASIKPLPSKPQIPNNHFAYIVTWFGLAFALCVMVFLYIRKELARGRTNHNPG